MQAISSYRGNTPTHTPTNTHTHPPTHRQDRLQYTAPQLARNVMIKTNARNSLQSLNCFQTISLQYIYYFLVRIVRLCESVPLFKRHLKTHLFRLT